MATYEVLVGGDVRMTFEGDFAHASCPLTLEGRGTPFQVADARHDPDRAAGLLNGWCHSEGGAAWGDGEDFEVVRQD